MQRLGIATAEWVQTDFDRLIPELLSHRFDLVAGGMFVTPERSRLVRMTRPTLRVLPGLLVQTAADKPPHSYAEAAATPGYRVAVVEGGVEGEQLRRLGLSEDRWVPVPDARTGAAAVLLGRADALALSWPAVRQTAAGLGGLLRALPAGDPAQPVGGAGLVAMQFRPADEALATAWDQALGRLVGGAAHLQLLRAQGLSADDLPDPPPAAAAAS
jgi:polar amino acid transport system substrate-binding protein